MLSQLSVNLILVRFGTADDPQSQLDNCLDLSYVGSLVLEQQTYREEVDFRELQGHPQLHCSLKNGTAGHLFEYAH